MKPIPIPAKISEYIRKNFRGEFLTDFKTVYNKEKEAIHMVDISHEDTLHHLRFNDKGVLLESVTEPLFEPDDYDGPVNED